MNAIEHGLLFGITFSISLIIGSRFVNLIVKTKNRGSSRGLLDEK